MGRDAGALDEAVPRRRSAAAEAGASLARHGVDASAEQQTKTRKALDIFSSHLRRDARAAAAARRLAEATPAASRSRAAREAGRREA